MDKRLIEDYFAGKCSPDKAREMRSFLESEEGRKYLTENLIPEYWNEAIKTADVERIIQQERKTERKLLILKVAASLALFLATGIAGYYIFNHKTQLPQSVAVEAKVKTIDVPAGKKTTYRLPDGSVVWLNSDSKISFYENLDGTERNIELEGEAYFEVKKDSLRPFRVKAGNVTVTALGTAFNVWSHEAGKLEVALKEGKVKVENRQNQSEKSLVLAPGEGAMLKPSGLLKTRVDQLKAYGWKSGILYFHKSSFNEVIESLERWYGVDFEIKFKPEKSWSFSGTYENETLNNVLLSLSKLRNFSYQIKQKNNKTIVIINNRQHMK